MPTIHKTKAAELTRYSEENLYKISQTGRYFAPCVNGFYDAEDFLGGIVKYKDDQHAKMGGTADAIKLRISAQRLRQETVKADREELKVLPSEKVDEINGHYFTEIVQRAVKIGPAVGMLTVGGTAQQNAAIIQDSLIGCFADLPRMKMLDDEAKKKIRALLYTKTESVSG